MITVSQIYSLSCCHADLAVSSFWLEGLIPLHPQPGGRETVNHGFQEETGLPAMANLVFLFTAVTGMR